MMPMIVRIRTEMFRFMIFALSVYHKVEDKCFQGETSGYAQAGLKQSFFLT